MRSAALLLVVYLSGAAGMSLEMASFRLFQPEFGSDIYVWGSLISVFLGGLAAGAPLGGWLADRRPSTRPLALLLVLAGAAAVALLIYAQPLLEQLSSQGALPAEWADPRPGAPAVFTPPDLRWRTLTAGLLIFGPSTTLLGAISPFAGKMLLTTAPRLGTRLGRIYGLSTLGAITGTLGTAFYLVTLTTTRQLIAGCGLVLVALGLVLAVAPGLPGFQRPSEEEA